MPYRPSKGYFSDSLLRCEIVCLLSFTTTFQRWPLDASQLACSLEDCSIYRLLCIALSQCKHLGSWHARWIVLLPTGYAYDRSEDSLLSKFAPQHLHLATTSGSQATGDGVRLGQIAGAALVDMDQIQVAACSRVPQALVVLHSTPSQ